MLTVDLGTLEYYDDSSGQFMYDHGGIVSFEYSLKAVYEWESKWKKPFLKGELTQEELMDFYMTMAMSPIESKFITSGVTQLLSDYIKSTNTATTFTTPTHEQGGTSSAPKIYTTEEIYALMFSAGVDIAFENRNLNRLLVILRIIGNHNNPPKKMSKQDILKQNVSLNAQRKAQLKTKG